MMNSFLKNYFALNVVKRNVYEQDSHLNMSFDYAAHLPPTRSAHLHCNARSAVQVSGTIVAGSARENSGSAQDEEIALPANQPVVHED
jgi:hypothetical protein